LSRFAGDWELPVIRYKSIVKGAGSYFVKAFRKSDPGDEGVVSANGAYAIFMRYLYALARIGLSFDGKVVVELGPGSSYGMGIASILSGARRYYAFDLIDHTTAERNLAIFDALVEMFSNRVAIPHDGFCARIFPFIDDPAFPTKLLPDSLLERTLHPDRLKAIRHDLASQGEVFIRSRSSADLANASIDEPANIIVSESVLEHVDDLKSTYAAFGRWLAPDGAMVHLIDYTSHNLSHDWNGHWQCSPYLWSLVRGKRYYLINRMPHHVHVDLLRANGFTVVHSDLCRRVDGLTRDQLSPEFRTMSSIDATTALASIACRRAEGAV
jgi:hypothetical protein